MAINLTTQYKDKVAERFKAGSKTDKGAGHDYEFIGAKTIVVYSVDVVDTVNYDRTVGEDNATGGFRFGKINELGDTKQELTVTQDKAFTFSIDAGNSAQQLNIKQANKCLKRQWDEKCTPEIDAYRLASWVAGKGLTGSNAITVSKDGQLTEKTIVAAIFGAGAQMSDDLVPVAGRTLYIPELTFVKFRLADVVMGADAISAENIQRGYRGTIDGMDVVTVPSKIFPEGYNFIIKYKNATVDPVQLKNLRVQKNPIGIDGDVVEGRYIYDSFVLNSKCKGVYASSTATT